MKLVALISAFMFFQSALAEVAKSSATPMGIHFIADLLFRRATKAQVAQLRQDDAIYVIDTGRICVAALNSGNIDYVADAIAKVL